MLLLSIPGTVRMILIIIAVLMIVRFMNRVMAGKRDAQMEKNIHQKRKAFQEAKRKSEMNRGKVSVSDPSSLDAEDVDYEDV